MSYFSYFPSLSYIVDVDKAKIINAKNILIRAKFTDYIKANSSMLLYYTLREGDRPDTVANTVYGRSDLHWVILLFNEILNPYHEWPLSELSFQKSIELKYPGTTLYVRDGSILSKNKPLSNKTPFFEMGSTIQQGEISATVLSFDANKGALVVDGGDFATRGFPGTVNLIGAGITHTNSLGNLITATITKKELTYYAVHHFEDANGLWLDSRCKFTPEVNATYGVAYRPYSGIAKSLIQLYADPSVDPTTGATIGDSVEVEKQVVRNIDYEYIKNENKRKIKILQPKYLDTTLKQFADIFKKRTR